MKAIICVLMMSICVPLSAQEVVPLVFTEVVPVENVSAEELFSRGRAWFATAYKDSKTVLQMAEGGKLIGKAAEVFNLNGGFALGDIAVRVTYDISVECRDGRYKYTINNIVAKSRSGWANFGMLTTADNYKDQGSGSKSLNKLWQEVKGLFNTYQMLLVTSLKESMARADQPLSGDDW